MQPEPDGTTVTGDHGGEGIDAEALEAIAAESKAQSRRVESEHGRGDRADGGSDRPKPEADGTDLGLTDPTDEDRDPDRPAEGDGDDGLGTGSHGVPDSL